MPSLPAMCMPDALWPCVVYVCVRVSRGGADNVVYSILQTFMCTRIYTYINEKCTHIQERKTKINAIKTKPGNKEP